MTGGIYTLNKSPNCKTKPDHEAADVDGESRCSVVPANGSHGRDGLEGSTFQANNWMRIGGTRGSMAGSSGSPWAFAFARRLDRVHKLGRAAEDLNCSSGTSNGGGYRRYFIDM
jgi:hypothetical protein